MEGPDPFNVSSRFGWQQPSTTNQEGGLKFHAHFRALQRRSSTALVVKKEADSLTSSVGAHQMPQKWYPGTAEDHKTATAWYTRDHSLSGEEGEALTAARKRRGEAVQATHRVSAALAKSRNAEDRRRRESERGILAARADAERLGMIDAQLKRLNADKERALAKTSEVREARREAARRSNRRVAAFRKRRREEEENAMVVHGAIEEQRNPLPLNTPFRYKASDLFCTFPEDER